MEIPDKKITRFIKENSNSEFYLNEYIKCVEHFKKEGWNICSIDNYYFIGFVKNSIVDNLLLRCIRLKEIGAKVTEEKFKLMYGEKIGLVKWKSYKNKQAYSNTFEYKKKKYGITEKEFDEFNKSRAITKKLCIKRHGIRKGKKVWGDYVEKQKDAGCSEKYFIEKYGKIKGKEKYKEVCYKKRLVLENFIKKYGKQDGVIRYELHLSNLSNRLPYSKASQKLFWGIYDNLDDTLKEHCYFAELNFEFKRYDFSGCYFYDFVISNIKFCLEFNGIYYHADPMKYDIDEVVCNNMKSYEIWKRDKKKLDFIISKGYYSMVVWENRIPSINDILENIYECKNR